MEFWGPIHIAENFSDITTELEKVNCKNSAKSLETYDFSTLYTTLPLTDLNEKLAWCIGKAFNGSNFSLFIRMWPNGLTNHGILHWHGMKPL